MLSQSLPTPAFKRAYAQTIAPPGGKLSRVILPAVSMPPDSKRSQLIENAEDDLEKEMDVLKADTVVRNMEIEARLEEIRVQGMRWKEKLSREVACRDETHTAILAEWNAMFLSFNTACEKEINLEFNQVENQEIPPEGKRHEVLLNCFRAFVDIEVPAIIEELQGSVTRSLAKSHETFDIDNDKLMKREERIIDRFVKHQKHTSKAFGIEASTRFKKFQTIGEDIQDTRRVDDRQSESIMVETMDRLVAMKAELLAVAGIRERDDLEMLEKLTQAMSKLQTSVLTNFGQE